MSAISSPLALLLVKPMLDLDRLSRAGIGGHDDHHIAKIRLAAVVVGQRAVVHHLQQHIEDVRVGFFDFVQQQHRVRVLGDLLGEQAACSKPT